MNQKTRLSVSLTLGLAAGLVAVTTTPQARANVYATNIKMNGSTNDPTVGVGAGVNISYILNDAATSGTTIKISSGTNVIRTIAIASGAGTTKGKNMVTWDGKDNSSVAAPVGSYTVSITAASVGYTNWTQITSDSFSNNYANNCRAIAVDKNTNSYYYGMIFVGNGAAGPNVGTVPGDSVGFCRYNADGSTVDSGLTFGTGGYGSPTSMPDDGGDCPLKARVGADHRLYFNDWASGKGEIVALDEELTTNTPVLVPANYATTQQIYPTLNWQCFDVSDVDSDTNGRIWMGDGHFPSGGVWVWHMTNGIADPNDTTGTQVIAISSDPTSVTLLINGGIQVDENTNIFIDQYRNNASDVANRAFMFTNYDGTDTLYDAFWAVGSADDNFRAMYDMALDSRSNPKYLAFASYTTPGGIRVLNTADGSVVVTNLDYGTFFRTINWDAVGNIYVGSPTLHFWRSYSPPGSNSFTTPALETINVTGGGGGVTTPVAGVVSISGSTVTVNFTGGASDSPSAFTLLSASNAAGPYAPVTATITQPTPGVGVFQATVAVNGAAQFYRIQR
jgi:hypothetical protein